MSTTQTKNYDTELFSVKDGVKVYIGDDTLDDARAFANKHTDVIYQRKSIEFPHA